MPIPRIPASWRRRIVDGASQRLALKATAVLLAVVLWFAVTAKEPTEELVPVRFTPELDSSLVLRDPLPPIRALVLGTSRDLLKLYATPPTIRRPITADGPDTVVVDLSPRDVVLPSGVDAIVQDVQPHTLTLRFEPTSTRVVPVISAVQVETNGFAGRITVRFDPDSVELSGPRRAVLAIPAVRTVRTVLPAQDSLAHLVDIDTTHLAGVRVKPTQVKVRLTLIPADSAAR